MAALAYPDRVGLRRGGDAPRYVLSGGKGAVLPDGDGLSGHRLIVATDLDGNPREARIRQAAALSEAGLRAVFSDQIAWRKVCVWDKRLNRVEAREQERFEALVLEDRAWREADEAAIARAFLDGVRLLGLNWSTSAARFAARVRLAHASGLEVPDMSETALLATLEDWLLEHVTGLRSAEDWRRFDMTGALRACLSWDQMQGVDRLVPGSFETPLGRRIAVDYSGEHPSISLRLQEMFGVMEHPRVGNAPLRVELLSPAGRPVQVTMDLPGFWVNSYGDVRKDMRGRYPKHPWPEDPTQADPTLRAKRRR